MKFHVGCFGVLVFFNNTSDVGQRASLVRLSRISIFYFYFFVKYYFPLIHVTLFLLSYISSFSFLKTATPIMHPSSRTLTNAFIVASKRTPFGAYGGKLSKFLASELGGLASKAALAELPSGTKVDATIFANVHSSDNSCAYLARHVGHRAGLPVTVPALTVNRLCGSGFQSIINAVQEIKVGDAKVVLTGGTESMSMAPYTLHGVRFGGGKFGVDLKLVDSLAAALTDIFPTITPMGITAENLGEKYGITREQCDEYALQTQQRYQKALEEGAFKDEIVPVEIKVKKVGLYSQIIGLLERPRLADTFFLYLFSLFTPAGDRDGDCR